MNKNGYLEAMGVQVWKPRRSLPFAKQVEQNSLQSNEALEENETSEENDESWSLLQQQVSECTACELHQTRTNTVFGVGNLEADWMIVGEAPGEEEDASGEPFVGAAGKMLNQMLLAIGVSREQVFIVNILKCRPPLMPSGKQRDPKQEEVTSCQHFLMKQINRVKPKVILAVGRVATQNLLQTKETIGHLRGNTFTLTDTQIPLVATFHPAYLLRSPTEKSKVWSDLVVAKKVLEGRL